MLNTQIYITLMLMFTVELGLCLINLITSPIQIGFLILWLPYLYLMYRSAAESKLGSPLGKKMTLICALIFMVSGGIGLIVGADQTVKVMLWKVLLNFIAGSVLIYYLMHWQSLKDIKLMNLNDKDV